MSEEVAAHVFEPFYRATSADGSQRAEATNSAEVANSAGLGLAIVAGIAEAHGGRIDLETAPNHGSCFTVRLPLAEEVLPSQGEEQSAPVDRPREA